VDAEAWAKDRQGTSVDARGALVVEPAEWAATARALRDEAGLDYLANLTAVDLPDRFETVYHVCSTLGGAPLTVKVPVG
jgi:NADH:ubiquinone oxidoreductase subunit C